MLLNFRSFYEKTSSRCFVIFNLPTEKNFWFFPNKSLCKEFSYNKFVTLANSATKVGVILNVISKRTFVNSIIYSLNFIYMDIPKDSIVNDVISLKLSIKPTSEKNNN